MEAWRDPVTLATWIAVGLLAMAVLVGAMAVFTRLYLKRMLRAQQEIANAALEHQQALLETSLSVQERERSRIAADLHDELMGKLNTLALAASSKQQLPEQEQLVRQSIESVRRIAHDLTPPLLQYTTLGQLMEQQLRAVAQHYHVDICVQEHNEQPLPGSMKLQVLRIFQELLSNALKHAAASSIALGLRTTNNYLFLSLRDDGKGFQPSNDSSAGLGLRNVELRAQVLNANHRYKQNGKPGTHFVLLLPQTASTQ